MIDEMIPPECQYNGSMSPQLTHEQRVRAAEIYHKAIRRYRAKWGTWPGWKCRAQILGGVNRAISGNLDRKYTWKMEKRRQGLKRYRMLLEQGLTRRQIRDMIIERGKEKKREREQQEIELRRAQRARPSEEASDRLWLRY